MEIEEMLGISAFVVSMIVLVYASIRDWKEREVPDLPWIILSAAGLVMFVSYSVYLTGFRWEYILLAVGTVMLIADIFTDREFNPLIFYSTAAVLFIIPLFDNLSEDIFRAWASIPLCYLVFIGMYMAGMIRGGADVKCLISLSIMFPLYPFFFGLPLIGVPDDMIGRIFVFSITVLFLAAILTLPLIIYFMIRNLKDDGLSRKMFAGYRMDVSEAENADVWPLEDIVDGELRPIRIPEEEEMCGIYSRLKAAGHERVLVTPMIPFIVFITAAAAFIFLIGNPLFLIF